MNQEKQAEDKMPNIQPDRTLVLTLLLSETKYCFKAQQTVLTEFMEWHLIRN